VGGRKGGAACRKGGVGGRKGGVGGGKGGGERARGRKGGVGGRRKAGGRERERERVLWFAPLLYLFLIDELELSTLSAMIWLQSLSTALRIIENTEVHLIKA